MSAVPTSLPAAVETAGEGTEIPRGGEGHTWNSRINNHLLFLGRTESHQAVENWELGGNLNGLEESGHAEFQK